MKLTAPSLRTCDPPETRAVYWSGASHAITIARDYCYGCKTSPIRTVLAEAAAAATDAYWAIGEGRLRDIGTIELNSLSEAGMAWYTIGGIDALTDVLDALPDSVVEHHPRGLKSLQNLRRSWIKNNHDLADADAKRIGLLK